MIQQRENYEVVARSWTTYRTPEEVLVDDSLNDAQKRLVLESWERDARELAVAEDENMGGGEPNVLDRVLKALSTLPAGGERPRGPSTMHGSQPVPSSAPGSAEKSHESKVPPTLSAEEARQGEIVLTTTRRRGIFIGSLAVCAAALIVAFWLA